jgi:hypothetical protein
MLREAFESEPEAVDLSSENVPDINVITSKHPVQISKFFKIEKLSIYIASRLFMFLFYFIILTISVMFMIVNEKYFVRILISNYDLPPTPVKATPSQYFSSCSSLHS